MPETKETLEQEGLKQIPENREAEVQKRPGEVMRDVRERQHVPNEIKSWMQKIEQDPTQMTTVSDDDSQPVLQPAAPTNPKLMLPTTREKFVEGFKKTLDEAGRWLSAFILRLIKKKKGNVKFKEE